MRETIEDLAGVVALGVGVDGAVVLPRALVPHREDVLVVVEVGVRGRLRGGSASDILRAT